MPTGSQLSVSGDIYYNNGDVGIGTTNPLGNLHKHIKQNLIIRIIK